MKQARLFFLLFVFLMSCSSPIERQQFSGNALGTTYTILTYTSESIELDQELSGLFDRMNQSMSTYHPNSDISRINRGDSLVQVDSLFRFVFNLSNEVYVNSSGYFDPTVGVLVNAWGFGPSEQVSLKPQMLDSLKRYVGFDKVRLDNNGRVIKANPNIQLDFNAIAKGYALDLIAEVLNQKGVDNYLIELGGEIVAKGINLDRDGPWVLGIDDPLAEEGTRELTRIITLSDAAMATSGNYRKFRMDPISGKKYAHTINPITGRAEPSNVLSASVIASDCATADAYATALMAMPMDVSLPMIDKLSELSVYLIYVDSDGETIKTYETGLFKVDVE